MDDTFDSDAPRAANRRARSTSRRLLLLPALSVLLLFAHGGGDAHAAIAFGAKSDFGVGTAPVSVAVGDVNRDGTPDVVTANQDSEDVSVRLGNGDGTFAPSTEFSVRATSVAIGDLNRDGKPDLVTANQNTDNVSVLLGIGDGTFAAKQDFTAGDGPLAVAIADFDLDGAPDVAAANQFTNDVSVLLGNGDGTLAAKTDHAVGSAPQALAVGDLDRDGAPDIATANANSANVSVLLGNGDGTFAAKVDYAAGGFAVAVGDLDRDGSPDLATANAAGDNVQVLLGNGDGTFAARTLFTTGDGPTSVAIGDLDRDGSPDLATANTGTGDDISILAGIGDGTFAAKTDHGAGTDPRSVAVGDLDLDGKPDLVTANQGSDDASVLLNQTTTGFGSIMTFAPRADLAWGNTPTDVAVGDLDRDGSPDLVATSVDLQSIGVRLGNGDGTFGARTDLPGASRPFGVAVGDLDRDGAPDIVTANDSSDTMSILLGNGDGTFAPRMDVAAGDHPVEIAVGDLDRDGDLDVVTANQLSDDVSVLLGNGDGTFAAKTDFAAGGDPFSVAIADFDRDGAPDIATANLFSDDVSILLGNGDGTFAAATAVATGGAPKSVATGDLNRDGAPDLVTANLSFNTVSVLLGNGDGTFAPRTDIAGAGGSSVTIGDLDRDGAPDVAAVDENSDTLTVLRGNGDGTLNAGTEFATGGFPHSVALGDLDRDGRPDLATANVNSDDVSVLLNTTDSVAPETTIDSRPADATNDTAPTFEFSADEPGSTFECSLVADGEPAAFGSCSGPGDAHTPDPELTEGDYTFAVRATDAAGNTDPTPDAQSFTLDTTAPAAPTITDTDPDSPANDNNPRIKGTANSTVDLFTTADCSGSPVASGDATDFADPGIEVTVADDTTTVFRATATDEAGNTSACSDSITYVEDSTAPAAPTITDTDPDSPANDEEPEVKGGSPADAVTVKLYADDASCADPADAEGTKAAFEGDGIAVSVAADATTELRVRAADAAGNVSACSDAFSYQEDSSAPETTIDSGPADSTDDTTPTFGFSADETGATFECSLVAQGDAAAFGPCSGPGNAHTPEPELTEGDYTFAVRATDPAGNTDPTPPTRSFTLEIMPPASPTTETGTGQGSTTEDPIPAPGGGTLPPPPAGGPAGSDPVPLADVLGPQLALARRPGTVRRNRRFRYGVSCPEGENLCVGRLTFATTRAVAAAKRKRRRLRVAATRFRLEGGERRVLAVRLSRKGFRLLRRSGRLRVRVRAVVRDAAGNRTVVKRTLTLKGPRRRASNRR